MNKLKEYIDSLISKDGLYISGEIDHEFEGAYLKVREKEQRVLTDEELKRLPESKKHSQEWKMRKRSAARVIKYFNMKYGNLLDLGCGNGWFANILAENNRLQVVGIDINLHELQQAARVFKRDNLFFVAGDIFKMNVPLKSFNFITINAAIQYFPDLDKLLKKLFQFLDSNGEIHVIDSPFYHEKEIEQARNRSKEYYKQNGVDEMITHYFHHSAEHIENYTPQYLYKPKQSKLLRSITPPDIPFPWLKIVKHDTI